MKKIYSKDNNRSNPLSLIPGGSVVSVLMSDGATIVYDKIKNISAYCKKASANPEVVEIAIGDKILYKKP